MVCVGCPDGMAPQVVRGDVKDGAQDLRDRGDQNGLPAGLQIQVAVLAGT